MRDVRCWNLAYTIMFHAWFCFCMSSRGGIVDSVLKHTFISDGLLFFQNLDQ